MQNRNQIDHMLINNKFKNCITNVRNFREADMDFDHLLMSKSEVKEDEYKNL